MRIFVCKDRYENIMTCIYDAWEWSLKNGHENMKIMKRGAAHARLLRDPEIPH